MSEDFIRIQISDSIRDRVEELKKFGEELNEHARRHRLLGFDLICTLPEEGEELIFNPVFADFIRQIDDSKKLISDFALPHTVLGSLLGERKDFSSLIVYLWIRDQEAELFRFGKFCDGSTLLKHQGLSLRLNGVSDFVSLAAKINSQTDEVSRYILARASDEEKQLLEQSANFEKRADVPRWKLDRTTLEDKFLRFLDSLLLSDWFVNEWGVKCISRERLNPHLAELRKMAVEPFHFAWVNRLFLTEVYQPFINCPRPLRRVPMKMNHYMPQVFWSMIADVDRTHAATYLIPVKILELGSKFVKLFELERIVKIDTCPSLSLLSKDDFHLFGLPQEALQWSDWGVDVENSEDKFEAFLHNYKKFGDKGCISAVELYQHFEIETALSLIRKIHERMKDLFSEIERMRTSQLLPEITVKCDEAGPKIFVGGKAIELSQGQKRGIVCLSLLDENGWFKVDDFSGCISITSQLKGAKISTVFVVAFGR
ncbi:MAG: hypothetical protein QM796_13075 [Chthoniobacteraceae bacterium]